MSKAKNLATLERGKVQLIKAVGTAVDNLNRTSSDLANQLSVLLRSFEANGAGRVVQSPDDKKGLHNSTCYICFRVGPEKALLVAKGRVAWCLKELLNAGDLGITGYDGSAPRVAAYIHTLRSLYHLEIETELETHSGSYPGRHARYRLRSEIRLLRDTGARR